MFLTYLIVALAAAALIAGVVFLVRGPSGFDSDDEPPHRGPTVQDGKDEWGE